MGLGGAYQQNLLMDQKPILKLTVPIYHHGWIWYEFRLTDAWNLRFLAKYNHTQTAE